MNADMLDGKWLKLPAIQLHPLGITDNHADLKFLVPGSSFSLVARNPDRFRMQEGKLLQNNLIFDEIIVLVNFFEVIPAHSGALRISENPLEYLFWPQRYVDLPKELIKTDY